MTGSALTGSSSFNQVCTTDICKTTAQSILADIDFNIDPCSDFYQYTCGGWMQNNKIADDRSSAGVIQDTLEGTYDVMRDILEGGYANVYKDLVSDADDFHIEHPSDEANYNNMKQYYDVCMDQEHINAVGPTPIYPDVQTIEDIFFPVPDVNALFAPHHTPQLTHTLSRLSLQMSDSLFKIRVDVDDTDPQANTLFMEQAELYLPAKEYYEDPEVMERYRMSLINVLTRVLGSTEGYGFKLWSLEKITSAVSHFIEFEIRLANITLKREDLQDPIKNYNPFSFNDLQKMYPLIDWMDYVNSFIPGDITTPDKIIVTAPSYFEDLNTMLTNTSLLTLQEYFIINFVLYRVYSLDETSRSVYRQMRGDLLSGTSVEVPRWRLCVDYVSLTFEHIMGRYYTLRTFGGEKERMKAEEFTKNIHKAWLNKLPGIDWLDRQTKEKAYEKINLIQHKVAYSTVSPDIRQPPSLQSYYQTLYVNTTSFYDSEIAIAVWGTRNMWKSAAQPFDKDKWLMSAQTVDAYYSPNANEIAIPAGILQSRLYNSYNPEYLNYGGIGMIIGHELTHAFDSMGRKYDGYGYLVDWWTNETSAKFEEKVECFIDQYSKFNITGSGGKLINVNGKMTLGENLADNGGFSASLLAYQNLRPNRLVEEPKLPGLETMSDEALFFINFGRSWCDLERDKAAEQAIFTDPHSPHKARVNGVVQNSPRFGEVFQCPVGSPMNPEKKCQIW